MRYRLLRPAANVSVTQDSLRPDGMQRRQEEQRRPLFSERVACDPRNSAKWHQVAARHCAGIGSDWIPVEQKWRQVRFEFPAAQYFVGSASPSGQSISDHSGRNNWERGPRRCYTAPGDPIQKKSPGVSGDRTGVNLKASHC
jgi:hypothetical protein